MDTRQLATFVKLAQTLSYAATARELYISQPAVTQQIERLEREVGARLFDRDTHKVELTAAGRSFYRDARDILARLEHAEAHARQHATDYESVLRATCITSLDMDCLPRLLASYRETRPDVHVSVSVGTGALGLAPLGQGLTDAVFKSRSRKGASAFSFRSLVPGRFVCIMRQDHPLASRDELGMADLRREDQIFLEEGACPPEMAEMQDRILAECPEAASYYSCDASVSMAMLLAGIGVAVMPDFAWTRAPGTAAVPLSGCEPLDYGVYWRKRDEDARVLAFVACAERVYARGR